MKTLLAALALALAIPMPAQAYAIYLLPQPYTRVCQPGEPLTVVYNPDVIQFLCWHGTADHLHYVGLTVTSDCGVVLIEPRQPSDGWYRITCHLVTD